MWVGVEMEWVRQPLTGSAVRSEVVDAGVWGLVA